MKIDSETTILLTGTYCSVNKGDATMQQVTAAHACALDSRPSVVIGTPFPDRDAPHYAPIPVVRSRRRNLPLGCLHLALLWLARMSGRRLQRYRWNAEIDAMTRASVVIDLSGDMLTEDYGPLVGLSHLLPLLQTLALDRPLFVCAQSVGPFRWLKPLARTVLARAAMITVREQISADLLDELGLPAGKVRKTADMAFLLNPAPQSRIAQILVTEGVPPATPGRVRLGVSVSALLTNRNNRSLTEASGALDALAESLDTLIAERHIDVILVPHVFGPGVRADDREVATRLAASMRSPVHRLSGEYRPEELKGVIAQCDAFIGCRMHANIAALDSGVPVLAIGYSHKTAGIMGELGLSEWVMPVDELRADTIINTVERLLDAGSTYRAALTQALPQMRKRAAENIEFLSWILLDKRPHDE